MVEHVADFLVQINVFTDHRLTGFIHRDRAVIQHDPVGGEENLPQQDSMELLLAGEKNVEHIFGIKTDQHVADIIDDTVHFVPGHGFELIREQFLHSGLLEVE